MNFLAIIGIVDKINKTKDSENGDVLIKVKVEKPFIENNDEDWYDSIDVGIDQVMFKNEIKQMSPGSIIGIKGRIKMNNDSLYVVGERVQIF
ncbi:MAG: hypothetical protein LBD05_00760 [Mycoplasmataceae bacterium]|nr:hypothetical protein [Mycoplasmataceae bacterium]